MTSFRPAKMFSATIFGLLLYAPCLRATVISVDTPSALSVTWTSHDSLWSTPNWVLASYSVTTFNGQFSPGASVLPVGGNIEWLSTPFTNFGSVALFTGTFINGLYTDSYTLSATRLSAEDTTGFSLLGSHVLTSSIGVPDAGSTILLFGIALAALATVRRKVRS